MTKLERGMYIKMITDAKLYDIYGNGPFEIKKDAFGVIDYVGFGMSKLISTNTLIAVIAVKFANVTVMFIGDTMI